MKSTDVDPSLHRAVVVALCCSALALGPEPLRAGDLNAEVNNMFNSLGVAGTVGVISPVAVGASIWAVLAPLGVAATLLMTVLLVTGGRLRRREGVVLLVLYALLVPVLLQA